VEGELKPGVDPDEKLLQEIAANSPSHVVFLMGGSNDSSADPIALLNEYSADGPAALLGNVRDNLYGPWTLGNMCANKFDGAVHFSYVGEENPLEFAKAVVGEERVGEKEAEKLKDLSNVENRFTVVEKFTRMSLDLLNSKLLCAKIKEKDEESMLSLLEKILSRKMGSE